MRTSSLRGIPLSGIALIALATGLACWFLLPWLAARRVTAQSQAVAQDLAHFSKAFQSYLRDKGDWPPDDAPPGTIPAGMEAYLKNSNWGGTTALGGRYRWQYLSRHRGQMIRASILITGTATEVLNLKTSVLESIDRQLDDGRLDKGTFRLGFANEPLWILEP